MIQLLINTNAPLETAAVTRFGGRPFIPAGADFQWPCCSACDGPMQFLGQIALEDHDARRLALLFMCQNDPGICEDWDADSGGNRALVVAVDKAGQLASVPEGEHIVRDTLYGARIENIAAENYDEAREQWAGQNHCSPRQVLGQIQGEPAWIQADETPACDHCENDMTFVAQLEEGPDAETEMNFGGGCAYVFRCACAQHSAKFLWQCG